MYTHPQKVKKGFKLFLLALGLFFVLSACTKKPSEQELSMLEEAKKAAEAANQQVIMLETEYKQLETELEGEKQALAENLEEQRIIKEKLEQ
ncbi:MAG: hypothetical protein HQK83_03365 [Fibrobacteria bacterium]|nr:hypothetical protein [Fibrobacteria bacterium]